MARKKIREYDSKRLLKAHIARLAGLDLPIAVAQVKENTNYGELVSGGCWRGGGGGAGAGIEAWRGVAAS